jgi:hypothetical protein
MRWTEELAVPITVVPADTSPLVIVNDPAVDPRTTGAIRVNAIRVTLKGTSKRLDAVIAIDGKLVPCSFDVAIRVGGKEYPLGNHVAYSNGELHSERELTFPSLPNDLRTADLIFRSNPKHAEGVAGVDRVWGGNVELLNQPVQRYDLEADAATQPQ